MTLEQALAKGLVPTARIAPILRESIERLKADTDLDFVGPYLADADRQLWRWENEVEYVGFDSADRQFCQLHLDVHRIWTEDLADIYYAITFREIQRVKPRRCRRRGCSEKVVPGPRATGKLYCSDRCKRLCEYARRAEREGRERRVFNKLDRCKNGHDRSPENLARNGGCLVCKREAAKARYHTDSAHRKRLVQAARDRRRGRTVS